MDVINMKEFEHDLRQNIKGEVIVKEAVLGIYATDASNYQIMPRAVVVPCDNDDIREAVQIAAKYGISILPRGGGTSLGGQAVGSSMIINFTKFMNKILELNVDEGWVRVQAGVILDELNAELAKHGLLFAPDPATSSRATIGGMIGNNASGTKSIVYGIMRDHVIESTVLLSDGTVLTLSELTAEEYDKRAQAGNGGSREAEILSGFKRIIGENAEEIDKRFPKVMRRVQGYNLDQFTNTDRWNLSKLVAGSEGSLAVVLETKLKLVPLPKHKVLCLPHFNDLLEGIRTVAPILEHGPSAVELMDNEVVTLARANKSIAPLCGFVDGDPAAILVVEFFGDTQEEATRKAEKLAADLKDKGFGYTWPVLTEAVEMGNVWSVRKNGLGLILGMKGERKPIPFIEDCCIPVDVLPEYIDRILKFCNERDIQVATYAHASVGTIHVRPILNLKEQTDIDHMKDIAELAFEMVKKYGGAWSGEHGDGRVRSPFLERYFGDQVYQAMRDVKKLFDPAGLMNPGVIIDPNPMEQDLRYGPDYKTPTFPTVYNYREDGSFAAAVELCTGVGACRQTMIGTMCPSYRNTLDEEHSPRGRSNALRLAMTGQLGAEGMSDSRVFEILDLCLSCKACKAECPSNVDVARLKNEFLQKYHDKKGIPLRERIIGITTDLAPLMAHWYAPIVNFFQGMYLTRVFLEIFTGFDKRRIAPSYASSSFPKWFSRRNGNGASGKKVVLFDDTYMNYHQTNVGISAVELLESCGYEVILANAGCCQRPRISHGMIRSAKKRGEKTLRNLDTYISKGLKVVVCEPGCCSALTDDLPDLIDDEALGKRIKENVMMIDVFLASEIEAGNLDCEFTSQYESILIHGHCHQKSLYGTTNMKEILGSVSGVKVEEINSGCCGMAGSFGYEKEHYDMSMEIGESILFPAIRNRDKGAAVVACGFSCRHQIADGTDVTPLHWVETLRGKAKE
jgi:FAD/FMN-containing dehydrogenase/Fe-S oxidoreductase